MDKDLFTGYNNKLTEKAKELRKNMTKQERKLWYDFLVSYPVKFYRQRPIDSYIADFYCSKAKLVIELDGSQHYTEEGMEYDSIRTETLELYGLRVIRFRNSEIEYNFNKVCQRIDRIVAEQIKKQAHTRK